MMVAKTQVNQSLFLVLAWVSTPHFQMILVSAWVSTLRFQTILVLAQFSAPAPGLDE
jgi:hypothetical protein